MLGLMQDWPLTVDKILDHAAQWHGDREVVTRSVEAKVVEEAVEASEAAAADVEAGAREAAAESPDVADDATIDGQDAVEAPADSPDDTTEE